MFGCPVKQEMFSISLYCPTICVSANSEIDRQQRSIKLSNKLTKFVDVAVLLP